MKTEDPQIVCNDDGEIDTEISCPEVEEITTKCLYATNPVFESKPLPALY